MSDDRNALHMYCVSVQVNTNGYEYVEDVFVTAPTYEHAEEHAIGYRTHDPVGYVYWLSNKTDASPAITGKALDLYVYDESEEWMDEANLYSIYGIQLVAPEDEAAIRKYTTVTSFDAYIRDKLKWVTESNNMGGR